MSSILSITLTTIRLVAMFVLNTILRKRETLRQQVNTGVATSTRLIRILDMKLLNSCMVTLKTYQKKHAKHTSIMRRMDATCASMARSFRQRKASLKSAIRNGVRN